MNHASDHDLIAALKNGDTEALTALFKQYWRPLYITAYQKVRCHETAEEIVQELFTELWDKRNTILNQPQKSLQLWSYLNTAVKNKALNCIRKKVYTQKYWEYCKQSMGTTENATHQLAEFNDLQQSLSAALERLSAKTREVFLLHKINGISVSEISKTLKLSEKAIGYHLTKSIKELRVYLKEFILNLSVILVSFLSV